MISPPGFQTTSASCDFDLWPPDPRGRPIVPVPWGKIYANLHWNRFIRFSKYSVHKLVTDEWLDRRADEGTGREHYASGQSRLAYG